MHEGFTLLDGGAVSDGDDRTDNDGIALKLTSVLAMDTNCSIHGKNDEGSVQSLHSTQVIEADRSVVFGLDDGLFECSARGTSDVEGTHGELGSRFADRLGGNDANRLAETDHQTGGKVATVALGADAALVFTSQHGANLELLVTDLVEGGGSLFVDQLIGLDDGLTTDRILDGLAADTPDDTGGQTDDFLVAFVDRTDNDAVDRTAIFRGDDHILRCIHQLAGQVTGISSLESRVGKSLTGTVR